MWVYKPSLGLFVNCSLHQYKPFLLNLCTDYSKFMYSIYPLYTFYTPALDWSISFGLTSVQNKWFQDTEDLFKHEMKISYHLQIIIRQNPTIGIGPYYIKSTCRARLATSWTFWLLLLLLLLLLFHIFWCYLERYLPADLLFCYYYCYCYCYCPIYYNVILNIIHLLISYFVIIIAIAIAIVPYIIMLS